jgi:hypothetical protein
MSRSGVGERGMVSLVAVHEVGKGRFPGLALEKGAVEGHDHVEDGPWVELARFILRGLPDVLRCGTSIDDLMVSEPAVVRAAVAEVHE